MPLLQTIKEPRDLRGLDAAQMQQLAKEIRAFLIKNVARTGGHLGPNLGVVELTLGIHRIFDSPTDSIIFDTGHQSYVHKLLTGRQDFSTLRQQGGLSGYPERAESVHDIVESSHASSSLSWADGISRARKLTGEADRYVVALVGDGALTGGMAWEAVNNIAADKDRRVVIVVNDNGRSYAPTIGGLADQLAGLRQRLDMFRTHPVYETTMDRLKDRLKDSGAGGPVHLQVPARHQEGHQGLVGTPGPLRGPGHEVHRPDRRAQPGGRRRRRCSRPSNFGGPVIVHALTEKGRGYAPARADEADQFHAVGVIDPQTGEPVAKASARVPGPRSSARKSPTSPTSARTSWRSPGPCCSRWA